MVTTYQTHMHWERGLNPGRRSEKRLYLPLRLPGSKTAGRCRERDLILATGDNSVTTTKVSKKPSVAAIALILHREA
ncbi:hypothetical protein DPMN_154554 [Dreissena polymorpha]|uniref:Uncharacterized protein n=1 Tax=Dreissena polymorpha TaxID=45954 RepID=A0A9D4FMU3_DREPO|nr:hypothetical protein DPMN_154554 [Dreissena polymorpha]